MYPASNKNLNKETIKAVYFFTPSFYPLDNFSAHCLNMWGMTFPTAEHAYQWKKFSSAHPDIAKKILTAKSPHLVKQIADANQNYTPLDWNKKKVKVMEKLLKAKAEQHEDVREALKRTEKRKIIENSPVDNFWGIGPNKNGKNMVGKIWMKIRDIYIINT